MKTAICRDAKHNNWLLAKPGEVLRANSTEEVVALFEALEAHRARGLWSFGWLSYEAAPAFDAALQVKPRDTRFPLAEFVLCEHPPTRHQHLHELEGFSGDSGKISAWQSATTPEAYRDDLRQIADYLAAGDTYQINYTFAMVARAGANFSARATFAQMQAKQGGTYASYFEAQDYQICSASPELFYAQSGQEIYCKPMKGTWARGADAEQDARNKDALHHSAKDRAENLMIVDMIRNDLSKIAKSASVRCEDVFAVEAFPRVLQMTTTVRAETEASLFEMFVALFPCASITGAPKRRSMQIIAELESLPRGPYCGAAGFIAPDYSQFSVAIRGVTVAKDGALSFGVGSGVTWYSKSQDEYEECQLKTNILNP